MAQPRRQEAPRAFDIRAGGHIFRKRASFLPTCLTAECWMPFAVMNEWNEDHSGRHNRAKLEKDTKHERIWVVQDYGAANFLDLDLKMLAVRLKQGHVR